jgi:3-dehydroquinate synthase
MRHGTPKAKALLYLLVQKLWKYYGSHLVELLSEVFHRDFDWRIRERPTSSDEDILERAKDLLGLYGESFKNILDLYPRELSNGAAAVARLIQAQLTPNLRVLFLDEAFSGVQADLWPKLVDCLREWQQAADRRAIVVVTHNKEELLRWNPRERFTIENKALKRIGLKNYTMLVSGLPRRREAFPVFHSPYSEDARWLTEFKERAVIIVDKAVANLQPTSDIKQILRRWGGRDIDCIEIEALEIKKNSETYMDILRRVLEVCVPPKATLIVIGGGITLNLGTHVAATLFRGRFDTVVVPTTVMAVADVAVGSKAALNVQMLDGSYRKHPIGTYSNPAAVLLDERYIENLSAEELVVGLSECLKHGLLHDAKLYDDVIAQLRRVEPSRQESFEIATKVMILKSRVLAHDPWEEGYGRTLLFGHLHAHSLERASNLTIKHGSAVYWGMLVEMKLSEQGEIYKELREVIKAQSAKIGIGNWLAVPPEELMKAYPGDSHDANGKYKSIVVRSRGQYHDPFAGQLMINEVELRDIGRAIEAVRIDLR